MVRLARTRTSRTAEYRECDQYLKANPGPYQRGIFNLTIDFELAWSRARRGDGCTSLQESLRRSRRARAALPALLTLSERYGIPITFAVVAHLAVPDCAAHDHAPAHQPSWCERDWYAVDPKTSVEANQDYYAT